MEPSDPNIASLAVEVSDPNITKLALGAFFTFFLALAEFMRRQGKNTKPEEPPPVQISGALVTRQGVDPLMQKLEALAAATDRLCNLMEKEVGLRQSSADEARRMEEQKRMALTIADQVREDILAEMRSAAPAPMPTVSRKRSPGDM
jgi:hypothetical protein